MANITAFAIRGLKLWFWSNDHEPPHFHAKRAGEWEVKVYFMLDQSEMVEVEGWSKKRPPRKILKELTTQAEANRILLLEQWEEIRSAEGDQE